MRAVIAFLRFWYRFVVGDDWRIAVGVTLTLALTAAVARTGIAAWWVAPLGALLVLTTSLRPGRSGMDADQRQAARRPGQSQR